MNIKEHIEAGHYPKNEAGQYLVPLRNGNNAIIYVTRHTKGWPIAGSVPDAGSIDGWSLRCWKSDGAISDAPCGEDLMWPSPRKERVRRYAVFLKDGTCWSTYDVLSTAEANAKIRDGSVVTLHGEREVPW